MLLIVKKESVEEYVMQYINTQKQIINTRKIIINTKNHYFL